MSTNRHDSTQEYFQKQMSQLPRHVELLHYSRTGELGENIIVFLEYLAPTNTQKLEDVPMTKRAWTTQQRLLTRGVRRCWTAADPPPTDYEEWILDDGLMPVHL